MHGLINNFDSSVKAIVENSKADQATKQLVSDVMKKLVELLGEIENELDSR